ncbi:MAG TPA: hypothetical protein PK410_04670, partial [Paludibacteraceae bacterium]|nr:hypothetical protein [Paludibacteraceae bacterium]
EQRTENPCVPGSIPGGTTCKKVMPAIQQLWALFFIVTYKFYRNYGSLFYPQFLLSCLFLLINAITETYLETCFQFFR